MMGAKGIWWGWAMVVYWLCWTAPGMAQDGKSAGMLFVKKQGKNIRTYFPGRDIAFSTREGQPVQGHITRITRDSIFLTFYQTAMVPTMFGTQVLDTLGAYPLAFSIANIGSFPPFRQKRNVLTSGYTYMVAGTAYLGLNAVNTAIEKQPYLEDDNLPRILAGLGVVAFGYILERSRTKAYVIGKKYSVAAVE